MTSSPYGPYELGYTRATMEKAMSRKRGQVLSQSQNFFEVRIEGCNSPS